MQNDILHNDKSICFLGHHGSTLNYILLNSHALKNYKEKKQIKVFVCIG